LDDGAGYFRDLADKGVFPSIRVGRRVLFRCEAINERIDKWPKVTLEPLYLAASTYLCGDSPES
jgi:hypothetical protein